MRVLNHLCQRVIDREKILVMEAEIVVTLYMFERFFPPSFFDIMVHLGREARLGGPVHFRWMYPFERYVFYCIICLSTFVLTDVLLLIYQMSYFSGI